MKIRYMGEPFGRGASPDNIAWVKAGDVGCVIETYPESPPIPGLYTQDGEPDTGLPAYVVVRFPNGVTAAVDLPVDGRRWRKER